MEAVRRYDVPETGPHEAFDRIAALAARRFRVPIALIGIVDADRIRYKARHGFDPAEVPRDPGLCASAILKAGPHILPDTWRDAAARDNPLVSGVFGLRFYAGIPLATRDGHNIGTICVMDRKPRAPRKEQVEDLAALAAIAMDRLELLLSARSAAADAQLIARETDHRVMNSLQFVASLLAMQGRAAGAADPARQIEVAAARVNAIARVHRHFVAAEAGTVPCLAFLDRLCTDLSDIFGQAVEVTGEEAKVPARLVEPIGLIVNELVTNAAKHGRGRIRVSWQAQGGMCRVHVSDEGDGLPAGFDPDAPGGLGMRVVAAMAGRLGGQLSCGANPDGPGAFFTVAFALPS